MIERGGTKPGEADEPGEDPTAAPYRGLLGRSRSEPHPVWMAGGAHRIVAVWVGVDAEADPDLAELACAGELHALDDGGQLAVPFLYHDARIPLFVLVVPESLRHRVLALRAELLAALASDASADVPAYVAEAELVIGVAGLLARLAPRPDDAAPVDDGELDELDEPESLDASDVRELEGEPGEADELEDVGAVVVPDLAETEVEADELETLDALEAADALAESDRPPARAGSSLPPELPDGATSTQRLGTPSPGELASAEYARPSDIEALEPSLAPPTVVPEGPSQAWLRLDDERVWLYVRSSPADARSRADIDVLLQRCTDRGPALVLSVVFDGLGSPELRRGVVEPQEPEQRAILARLADSFELELVSLSATDAPLHVGTLYAPREANVRDLLAWFDRTHEGAAALTPEQRAHALEAAPPWRELAHPFQPKPRVDVPVAAPAEATEAAVALDELALWLSPERLEHVRLDLSVSDELIELRAREALGEALDAGLALEPGLAARALALGVAADARGLLSRRIAGLCRTSAEPDHGGIPEDVLRALWAEVLEQAPRLGVALAPEVELHAVRYAGQRALEHARVLAQHTDDALAPLRLRFERGERGADLLAQLVGRGGVHDVVAALQAASAEGGEHYSQRLAQLAQRGGVIGADAAQALLASADSLDLRAGAAAVLAALRATAALPELVRLLGSAGEAEARVLAWCLGRYGVGSFRAVCRVLAATPAPREREAWVLAALVQHGARAQVRARARSQSAPEAQLAAHALELANQLKETGNPFVGLEQQGALTVFFESFDRARQTAAEQGSGGASGVGVDSASVVP